MIFNLLFFLKYYKKEYKILIIIYNMKNKLNKYNMKKRLILNVSQIIFPIWRYEMLFSDVHNLYKIILSRNI